MLLEALVITICIQGQEGCGTTTSAYYKQSKELQALNKRAQKISKDITKNNKWLVFVGTPLYAIAVQKPARILVYRGTTLNLDPWKQSVALQWSW